MYAFAKSCKKASGLLQARDIVVDFHTSLFDFKTLHSAETLTVFYYVYFDSKKECMLIHTYMYMNVHVEAANITDVVPFIQRQGVSQDLKIGCPNLLEISKQGVQIVHLQCFYMYM